jgi:hypothetical protein
MYTPLDLRSGVKQIRADAAIGITALDARKLGERC